MAHPEIREPAGGVRERPGGAVRASWLAKYLRARARTLAVALAAGVFLAASGAFGSGGAPWQIRFPYWIGLMVGGTVLGGAMTSFVERRGGFEARPWLISAALALAMSVPMTVIVWAATAWVYGLPLTGASLLWFYPPVLLVAAAMTSINMLVNRRPAITHAASAANPGPPRFLERLPLKLRGADLYAVEAEDHYLRLHTSRGSDLILLRLSDAVAELEGLEGAQTHRSWWVAKDAVVDARAGDGRATLVLKNGVEAPVSRRYAPSLRRERWW